MNAVLKLAQLRYDHECPPADDGAADYLGAQVDLLMQAEDSDLVPFFDAGAPFYEAGFAEAGTEAIAETDDREAPMLQLVLACLRGKHDLADKLAERFREPLRLAAARLITRQMEKEADA